MTDEQLLRYSRHILLDDIGIDGQERLLAAHAVVVGAGGLGSPVALYLASAGVGRITLIDPDTVDATNLQRQIAHDLSRVGLPKVQSAQVAMHAINPEVRIDALQQRADDALLDRVLPGADVLLDCTDNFRTRHLINRASVRHGVPLVSGAAIRFDGQLSVYDPREPTSPCYACLFPDTDALEETRCATMGVFAPPAAHRTVRLARKRHLAKGQPTAGVTGFVLLQTPRGLQQAQHSVQRIAAGIGHQCLGQRRAHAQAQTAARQQGRAALLQRAQQVCPGEPVRHTLAPAVVAFIRTTAQYAARQQPGVGLERDAVAVLLGLMQPGQRHPRRQQARHPRVQHKGHGRVDPFHARARPCRPIRGPVGKLVPCWPCGTKSGEGGADLGTLQRGVVRYTVTPLQRPTQRLHQRARQPEGKIETPDPRAVLAQRLAPDRQAVVRPQRVEHHLLRRTHRPQQAAHRMHDRLAPRGRTGEVAPQQPRSRRLCGGLACAALGAHTRPMMLAVAMSSSSSASDTLPETL